MSDDEGIPAQPPTSDVGRGRTRAEETVDVARDGAVADAVSSRPPPGSTPFDELPTPQSSAHSPRPVLVIVGAVMLVAALVAALVVFMTGGDDDEATGSPVAVDSVPAVSDGPDPAEIVIGPSPEELSRSVVQILAVAPDGRCSGSGTIIEASGVILTNSHVVARTSECPWESLQVATVDTPDLPPRVLFTAEVVADDPTLDLAVVRLTGRLDGEPIVPNFPAIAIGDSSALVLGERLNVLGFPGIGGETITFTEGSISGFVEQPGLGVRSWIKTDTTIAGGNSGGLAADVAGRIVGIPTRAGTDDFGVTDCRRVEDTNGDGTIDENDSCIPIGGFINGIRPIDLASGIIAEGLAASLAPAAEPTAPPTTQPLPAATAPPTTQPLPAATAPPTTTAAPTPAPVPSDGPAGDAGTSYVTIEDRSGVIRVSVPTEWSDIIDEGDEGGEGFRLWAAPDLAQYSDGWAVPGVQIDVTYSESPPDVAAILDRMTFASACEYAGREPADFRRYVGSLDRWVNCGGTPAELLVLAVSPEFDTSLALMLIQAIEPRDREAAIEIFKSFEFALAN